MTISYVDVSHPCVADVVHAACCWEQSDQQTLAVLSGSLSKITVTGLYAVPVHTFGKKRQFIVIVDQHGVKHCRDQVVRGWVGLAKEGAADAAAQAAPIFQVADYGLVADLFDAVAELTDKL